jgi:transposase
MRKKRKSQRKVVDLDALEQINLNAAGIDIGAKEIFVAVPKGRDEETVRSFPTFTADLRETAKWLEACGIETVAMESTGVYWIPLYEILEHRGFDVNLVNARHVKNVTGRKSDALDCQWIQQLHTYGLLQPSFRPPEDICAIRSLVRHRDMLIRYRAAHIQHMQKALELMNLRLTNVLSDVTGVTGMHIIRAIVAGERDPHVLARYRDRRCAKSKSEIVKSLEGNYKREHLFALKQALELYDFYDQKLQDCDAELEALYNAVEPPDQPGSEPPAPRTTKRRKNQPYFDLAQSLYRLTGVDLTAIDGLDALTIQTILGETGVDMSPWPTDRHFASWLRLAPNNRVTGGKVKRRGTQPTQNRASVAFRIAAQTLARSDSALGAFYRRIRARHGAPKAVTATAHKLARIFYFMLKHRQPYRDPGAYHYEQQYRTRVIRNLQRKRLSSSKRGPRCRPLPLLSRRGLTPLA